MTQPTSSDERKLDMTFDNTNRGALFRNDRKEGDSDPDYRGGINVDGREFWLNAWIKEAKSGGKYMSLSVKPKQSTPKARTYEQRRDDLNDEIGF